MELLDYTTAWVKGEVFQGKIMLALGAVVLVIGIAILRSQLDITRGMLIPLALILVVLFGYGGFQVFGRPGHIEKVSTLAEQDFNQAVEKEVAKAKNDVKVYTNIKYLWTGIIVICLALFFVFSSEYMKGLMLGCIFLFLSLMVLDTVLHQRLEVYLTGLESLS